MISPLSLILFSGHEVTMTQNDKQQYVLSMDSGWIRFPATSYTVRSRLLLQLILSPIYAAFLCHVFSVEPAPTTVEKGIDDVVGTEDEKSLVKYLES